jgi:hypothetical protein
MNEENNPFKKKILINLVPILIGTVVVIKIILDAYIFGNWISSDSISYLRAANSILEGSWFRWNTEAGYSEGYFSVWPIGYPLLIALISWFSGFEVYLSSKILSIILTFSFLFIAKKLFGTHITIIGFMILNESFLNIFRYTWSEQPFIIGMMLLLLLLVKFNYSDKFKAFHYFIYFTFVIISLFSFRYVGIFSLAVLGLNGMYYFYRFITEKTKDDLVKFLVLVISGITSIIFILSYLYYNLLNTGHLTGVERIPAPESFVYLFLMLVYRLLIEIQNSFLFFRVDHGLIIVFVVFVIGLIIPNISKLFILLKRINISDPRIYSSIQSFLIGIFYLIAIVSLRFISRFDSFNYRLIYPGFLFIMLGILFIVIYYYDEKLFSLYSRINNRVLFYLFLFLIINLIIYPLGYRNYSELSMKDARNTPYLVLKSNVLDRYSFIEKGSIVISADRNLNFMRNDLIIENFGTGPYSIPEPLDDFFDRLIRSYPNSDFYIDLQGFENRIINATEIDSSIKTYFDNNFKGVSTESIIKIDVVNRDG